MKKSNLLFLIIFICSQLMGQNIPKEEFQKDRYNLGQTFLKKGKSNIAIMQFFFAHHIIPDNELGKIAHKKYDSLKPIIREDLLKNICGNWKKIYDGPSWVTPDENGLIAEMITINPNEILFFELYKKAKKWILVKTEPLVFCKKAEIETTRITYDATFTEFVYKNKEVWQYYIDEDSGFLKVYQVGNEIENEVSEIICGSPKFQYFKLQ